ncbi:MAG TPA: hypothetical protein VF017_15915 [Thermoanaerobaculia bacterium]|nr:hypothetical protein [Thermoanaerobaculia bacterium]
MERAVIAGVDLGATLTKLALGGEPGSRLRLPSRDLAAIRAQLRAWSPEVVALTGGGARELGASLAGGEIRLIPEFAAWTAGVATLAAEQGLTLPPEHLVVSLGTGTSILAVRPGGAERVGGTALGGGSFVGLSRLLGGTESFAQAAELAARGDRRRVDLLVGDVYPRGGIALPPDLNAASFAKLASTAAADLAHAVAGMIGENVALLAMAHARAAGIDTVVYGGSTLDGNPALGGPLTLVTESLGGRALLLAEGAWCGAVGAARLAADAEAAPMR